MPLNLEDESRTDNNSITAGLSESKDDADSELDGESDKDVIFG